MTERMTIGAHIFSGKIFHVEWLQNDEFISNGVRANEWHQATQKMRLARLKLQWKIQTHVFAFLFMCVIYNKYFSFKFAACIFFQTSVVSKVRRRLNARRMTNGTHNEVGKRLIAPMIQRSNKKKRTNSCIREHDKLGIHYVIMYKYHFVSLCEYLKHLLNFVHFYKFSTFPSIEYKPSSRQTINIDSFISTPENSFAQENNDSKKSTRKWFISSPITRKVKDDEESNTLFQWISTECQAALVKQKIVKIFQ